MNKELKIFLAYITIMPLVVGSIMVIVVLMEGSSSSKTNNPKADSLISPESIQAFSEADERLKAGEAKRIKHQAAIKQGKDSGAVCLEADEAAASIGRNTCVAYRVGYLYQTGSGYTFLNEKEGYDSRFVAPIFNINLSFESLEQNLLGKTIAVSGTIGSYEGKPQIIVNDMDQITYPRALSCYLDPLCGYTINDNFNVE